MKSRREENSYHKYCRMVANELQEGGFSVQEVFTLPVTITKQNVFEGIWKRFMTAMYPEITSTTDPLFDHEKVSAVYEAVNAALSTKYGVSIPFPKEQGK